MFSVIDALYRGMLDEEAWNCALLGVADAVSGDALILFSTNPSSGEVFRSDIARLDLAVMQGYQDTWIRHDPRHAAGLRCPVGEPQIDGMLIDVRQFQRSSIYNEFFRPSDVPFHLAAWLERRATRGVVVSVLGGRRRGSFNEEDRARMAVLIPHIRRVVSMKDRLARAQMRADGMLELMERLPCGVLLLGPGLEILEASTLGRSILASRSAVHADGGRLGFLRHSDARAFAARLKEDPLCARLDDCIVVSRDGLRPPVSLLLLPLKPSQQGWLVPAAGWLVLIFDPEINPQPEERLLARAHDLTPAESRLACRLAVGMAVERAASGLGISVNTARTQLKAIFAKTGARSQAQLIQRICNGPGGLRQD